MFRQILKNKKAQNTAEYALLIGLVIAGVVAMQTYAQRTLQAKTRDASQFFVNSTGTIGNTTQYEPYYQSSDYQIERDTESNKRLAAGTVAADAAMNTTRNGSQTTTYNAAGLGNGI